VTERLDMRALGDTLRKAPGLAAKAEIGTVVNKLGLSPASSIPVGDDCAAIPDGEGYLLFAIEGLIDEFVAADPWFAGWCGAMVNISDVAAMGGRPIAMVDAIWADRSESAGPILAGLSAAAEAFAVPIAGGHANLHADQGRLSVAILGRASRLLTSFEARPGDRLVAAIDLRGRYRDPFANWDAATSAPVVQLRSDLELLPRIAEAGLSRAAKDISQGGIVGTAAMLAECSGVGVKIDVGAVPKPDSAPIDRWLMTFPSFGYLLAVAPDYVGAVSRLFRERDIAAADIGGVLEGDEVAIADGDRVEVIWDFARKPLIGAHRRETVG
jgi:uncharacterized protein